MVAFFPHAQELGTHSQHVRHGLDAIACHALTSRAGSIGGVGSLSRVVLAWPNIASTCRLLPRVYDALMPYMWHQAPVDMRVQETRAVWNLDSTFFLMSVHRLSRAS